MGTQRLAAVLAGTAAIYPSPNPQRPGCVEVRFIGKPCGPDLTSYNERFIDYGEGEVLVYVKFAAAMGDLARLAPPLCTTRRRSGRRRCASNTSSRRSTKGAAEVAAEWRPLVEGMHSCADNPAAVASPEWRGWDAAGTWGSTCNRRWRTRR